jgi:uncharacterized protein YndB with AHSA1/START domain
MSERRLVVERVFAAPAAEVFAAWGDAASMSIWMCPAASIRSATVETDFRVGGHFRVVMHGAESDFVQHGAYLALEPPKRIVMEWNSEWLPEAVRRTLLRIELEPLGPRRTRLVLVHETLPEGSHYDGHAEGWAEILRRFDLHLSEGVP